LTNSLVCCGAARHSGHSSVAQHFGDSSGGQTSKLQSARRIIPSVATRMTAVAFATTDHPADAVNGNFDPIS
jgi:hypothetical protein